MAWGADAHLFAAACANNRVYVWNTATTPTLHAPLEGHEHAAIQVAFNHRGDLLASSSWDGTVRLWDPHLARPLIHTLGTSPWLCFSPDDTRLATATDGSRVGYWEVFHGPEFRAIQLTTRQVARRGDLSPDGQWLALAEADGTHVWDLAASREVARLPGVAVQAALFQRDGKALITSGLSGLHRWPITPGATPTALQLGPPQLLTGQPSGAADLCDDGRLLAVTNNDRQALIFNLGQREAPVLLDGHANLRFVAVSPEGNHVATGTWHGSGVHIWDARSGRLVRELPIPVSATVLFSPDGKWLVTSTGADCCLWERETWQLRHRIRRDRAGDVPASMAFTRQGELLALTISPHVIQLVDPATGQQVATFEAPHLRNIDWVGFDSAGGQLLAVTSELVQVWDLRLVREKLAEMQLGWGSPPACQARRPESGKPVAIQVILPP
jgi:WD40 repeat protein